MRDWLEKLKKIWDFIRSFGKKKKAPKQYPWEGEYFERCTVEKDRNGKKRRDMSAGTREVFKLVRVDFNSQYLAFWPKELDLGAVRMSGWTAVGRVFFMFRIGEDWVFHNFGGWVRAGTGRAAANEFWKYCNVDSSGADEIWVAIGAPNWNDSRRTSYVKVKG